MQHNHMWFSQGFATLKHEIKRKTALHCFRHKMSTESSKNSKLNVQNMSFEKHENEECLDNVLRSSKYPLAEHPNISVGEFLSQKLSQQDPNKLAMIDAESGERFTYGQLHRRCLAFAQAMICTFSLKPNDFVMFFAENSIQHLVAMLSTAYIGLPFCPIPPANGPYEFSYQIQGCTGTILIIGKEKRHVLQRTLQNLNFSEIIKKNIRAIVELNSGNVEALGDLKDDLIIRDKIVRTLDQLEQQFQGKGTQAERLLKQIPYFGVLDVRTERYLICFTSGTTGAPKGAIHTHYSILAIISNYRHLFSSFGNKVALWHPLGHIIGTVFITNYLISGLTVVLFADSDIGKIIRTVPRYGINQITFSVNQATPLASENYEHLYDLSSLKAFKHAGSKIASNLLFKIKSKYNVKMCNIYGSTEFFGHVIPNDPLDTFENFVSGNCGRLCLDNEMKIIDLDTRKALPANLVGEICFRGSGKFVGYLNNPEATRDTIDQYGWYHSGDLGYYDDQGRLFIKDRIKEMIKFRLYSVIPAEIEEFLHQHPAVSSVCVVGVPHVVDGKYIRAYVELRSASIATEQELIDYVRHNMGFQKRLRAGVRLLPHGKMPRTAIGKVDRKHFNQLVRDELLTEIVD